MILLMKTKTRVTNFGERLVALRKQKGLTLEQLGKLVGVSFRVISYYERETKNPPTHLIIPLANALQVSIEELLGIKPTKKDLDPDQAALWRKLRKAQGLSKRDQKDLLRYLYLLLQRKKSKQIR